MKRLSYSVLAGLALVMLTLLVGTAQGDRGNDAKQFVGLWEGVDVNDGSRRTISISDIEDDGVFELSGYDTFWTICGSDRALQDGVGTVTGDTLSWSGTILCIDLPLTVPLSIDYTLADGGVLVETPLGVPLGPDILHRVSSDK